MYSAQEATDMLLILGECQTAKYPQREHYLRNVFIRLLRRSRVKGSLLPDHNKGNIIRINPNNACSHFPTLCFNKESGVIYGR